MALERLDLAPVVALLASVTIMVLGNGLLGTLLGVRAVHEGFASETIGLLMSGYFVGYVVGAWHCPHLIVRAGHVRSFAAFASVASVTTLAHPIVIDPIAWTALRIVNGYCYAGMIMIAESWLNGHALRSTRGQLLTIYGALMMAAWGVSQFLLNAAGVRDFILFSLASALLSLGLVPLTLAQATRFPSAINTARMSLRRLFAISPLGTVGVFVSGLGMTSFWAMGPPYAHSLGLSDREIALFMAATMFGGLLLQWPIGWLSDRYDRRAVVLATGAVTATAAAPIAVWTGNELSRLLLVAFVFGGAGVTIYSLCIAHSNDHIDESELLPLASSLVLLYGVGGAVGPTLAGQVMGRIGAHGLFLYIGSLQLLFVLYGLHRLRRRAPIPEERQEKFVAMPATQTTGSPVALQMDPRAEKDGQATN